LRQLRPLDPCNSVISSAGREHRQRDCEAAFGGPRAMPVWTIPRRCHHRHNINSNLATIRPEGKIAVVFLSRVISPLSLVSVECPCSGTIVEQKAPTSITGIIPKEN